jgi:hypothetical protein
MATMKGVAIGTMKSRVWGARRHVIRVFDLASIDGSHVRRREEKDPGKASVDECRSL